MLRQLRPEAGIADWETLDAAQKDACRRIVKMLGEAIEDFLKPKTNPDVAGPNWLARSPQISRIALLSGNRGTGKSTVLKSLAQMTSAERMAPTDHPSASELHDVDQEFTACLNRARNHSVWLRPLEMETVSNPVNLLAAILARIEDSVRGSDGFEFSGRERMDYESRGLLDKGPEYHNALLEFQRLQSNATLAWDSNLPSRRGSLDTDSYVVELMRGERARLALTDQLETALENVASKTFAATRIRSPLFILPIDDLDLNPQACLNVLRLVQMISVPRLFTLVLGDIKVAEVVLNLKFSSDLAGLSKDICNVDLLSVPAQTVGAVAAEIASHALRKLIPPNQRVHLDVMELREALEFQPLGGPKSPSSNLRDLMKKCPLLAPDHSGLITQPGGRCVTLESFLFVPPLPMPQNRPREETAEGGNPSDSPRLEDSPYTGITFLRTTPRRVADFWFVFKKTADLSPADSEPRMDPAAALDEMMRVLAEICRQALTSVPLLLADDRDLLRDAIYQSRTGQWRLEKLPLRTWPILEFADRMELAVPMNQASTPARTAMPEPGSGLGDWQAEYEAEIHCRKQRGWQFESLGDRGRAAAASSGEAAAPERFLRAELVSELILFHDVLALRSGFNGFSSLFERDRGHYWAVTEWRFGGDEVRLPWPVPPLTTFWEHDLFLKSWNDVVDYSASLEPEQRLLTRVYGWIAAGAALVTQERPGAVVPEGPGWQPLAEKIEMIVKSVCQRDESPRAIARRQWLIDLAAMFMPESGWPNEIRDSRSDARRKERATESFKTTGLIIKALGKSYFANKVSPSIGRVRAERLAQLSIGGMELLAQRLNEEGLFGGFSKGVVVGRKVLKRRMELLKFRLARGAFVPAPSAEPESGVNPVATPPIAPPAVVSKASRPIVPSKRAPKSRKPRMS